MDLNDVLFSFDYKDISDRLEFLLQQLFIVALTAIFAVISYVVFDHDSQITLNLMIVPLIFAHVYSLIAVRKRMNDLLMPWYAIFMVYVPFVNFIFAVCLFTLGGEKAKYAALHDCSI